MSMTDLNTKLKPKQTIEKEGIFVAKEIANKTVWDDLAVENPTHAVISAGNEDAARQKSLEQIADIKEFVNSDDVVLDCGCGYGRVAQYLLPDMPLKGYIGVDSSYQMLKLFQTRYETNPVEQKTPLLLINADIHTIPLADDSVDAVLVCAVFLHNHKEVVSRAMQELKRVLKPGGKLLVYSSFPRSASLMGLQGLAYQAVLNLMGKPYKNGPVRYYRSKEIKNLLSDFDEYELRPYSYAVLPKTIIGLPRLLEVPYRVGIANPTNSMLEKITPARVKPYFSVFYDVYAKR